MRALVLFALTFVLSAALVTDATACGRRKKATSSVVTYSVAPASGCCGSTGSYYGGSSYQPYYGGAYSGTSYYGGSPYHSGHYDGSPYYGAPYSYPSNYGGPALMPRVMPGSVAPGSIPFWR